MICSYNIVIIEGQIKYSSWFGNSHCNVINMYNISNVHNRWTMGCFLLFCEYSSHEIKALIMRPIINMISYTFTVFIICNYDIGIIEGPFKYSSRFGNSQCNVINMCYISKDKRWTMGCFLPFCECSYYATKNKYDIL